MTKITRIVTPSQQSTRPEPSSSETPEQVVQCCVRPYNPNHFDRVEYYASRYPERAKNGFDPMLCQRAATIRIDGKPYCRPHAGQRALDILIEEGRLQSVKERN